MGTIARLYNFVAGTRIRSAEVDAELDSLVSAHNGHDLEIDNLQTGIGLTDGSVVTAKLADLGVTTAKLAASAVTTSKIADANVTTAKLSDSSVTLAKMADSSVGTAELVDLSVTTAKIAIGAVGVSQLSPGAAVNESVNNALITALSAETVTGIANVQTGGFGAVGDGVVDDTAAFVSALLANDCVFVPFGYTYLIDDVDVIGKKIFGNGTIKKKSTSESAFHLKGTGSVIEGLFFLAESTSGQPSADIKLGDGAKNIRIDGCTFRSNIYSAIAAAVESLAPVSGTPYTTRVSGVIISNCVFSKLDAATLGYARPLFMHSVDNLTIQGNLIRDTSYDAIRIRENDGFVLIDGNQFINIGDPSWPDTQTRDAIDTYWSGANLTITNNIIRKTACFGFDIKGYAADGSYGSNKVIIANNQIYQCRYSGISIAGDANYDGVGNYKSIYGVIISNNVIQECNQNNITGTGSVGDGGILLSKLFNGVTISDNYIAFNYGRGIYAHNEDVGKAMGKNLTILSNMCVNNGQSTLTGSGTGGAGIVVFGVERVIMTDNICDNDTTLSNPYQQAGIYHASTEGAYTPAKLSIITDNICTNNVADQFLMNSNNNRLNAIAIFERNVQIGTQSSFRGSWQYTKNVFFGSVAPTSAEGIFNTGDVVFNINITDVRNISHWIHQGLNVWRAFGTGWGTTANRPALTANDAGYSYMDTTIAKMILWNGTAWLV